MWLLAEWWESTTNFIPREQTNETPTFDELKLALYINITTKIFNTEIYVQNVLRNFRCGLFAHWCVRLNAIGKSVRMIENEMCERSSRPCMGASASDFVLFGFCYCFYSFLTCCYMTRVMISLIFFLSFCCLCTLHLYDIFRYLIRSHIHDTCQCAIAHASNVYCTYSISALLCQCV